jgi:hypothetical protein
MGVGLEAWIHGLFAAEVRELKGLDGLLAA